MRGVLAAVGVVLVYGVASAQPADKNKSSKLFEEGRELAKQNKWVLACEKFDASLTIDRAPGTSLNYGDCLEHLGQLRKAWQMYDAAARDFDREKDARGKFARERADAVVPKLLKVVIRVGDPALEGLIVTVGDTSVAVRPELTELVEPGDIAIKATAPGHATFTSRASGAAGTSVIVEVPALLGDAPPGAVSRPVVDIGAPREVEGGRRRSRVVTAAVIGGVGVAALATSGVIGLVAKGDYDDAEQAGDVDGVNAAVDQADLATVFAIGGGVLLVTGAVIYFTAPRERVMITPTGSASSVGLAFSGRF